MSLGLGHCDRSSGETPGLGGSGLPPYLYMADTSAALHPLLLTNQELDVYTNRMGQQRRGAGSV